MPIIKNRLISVWTAIIVLMITSSAILGWILDITVLRALIPGLPSMVPMTATCMLLTAAGLMLSWKLAGQKRGRKTRSLASLVFAASGVIVVCNLISLIMGVEIPLLRPFLTERLSLDNSILYQGRMSVQTSIGLLFLSGAMIIINYGWGEVRRWLYAQQFFIFSTSTLGVTALIGYLHDVSKWGPSAFIGLSLPTAACFLLVSVGVIALEPDKGLLKVLRRDDAAGLFLRGYITFGILFPIVSSSLLEWGEHTNLYPASVGSTLFVLLNIILLLAMGIGMAMGIRRWEQQRLEAEQAIARVKLEATEGVLQETKSNLEFALRASDMGTIERSFTGPGLQVGGNTIKILDLSDAEMRSHDGELLKRIHVDDVAHVIEARDRAVQHRLDMNVDFRYHWRDGSLHWVRFKGRAKYNSEGQAQSLNGTLVDITAEKQHQADLEQALRAAESANSLKSSFLANMSHEIRTPLGAILGFTDLLQDPQLEHEERSRYLQVIQRNGESLSRLINDILDLSKVESGHLDIERIPVSVKGLVNEVVSLLEVRAKEKNIYLEVEYLSPPPELIVTDPVRVKQILVNLIGNALKFTEQGGVRLNIRSSKGEIQFFVEDTGVGIDMNHKDKLFRPFSQADSSTTRVFGGTGLGLALSSKLADLLGGSIQLLSSTIGKGSVFLFTIQGLREITAAEIAPVRGDSSPTQKLKDCRILICEDSPDIQKLLRLILRKEGVVFDLASNGLEGFEKATQGEHDIILMDIQMPVLDGYLATKNLREAGYKKPIIALTAHAMSDERERCFAVGCNDYLSKPIDRDKLINTIYRLTSANP